MDAFTLLKNDHAEVSAKFKQLEATSEEDADARQQLFNEIKQALEVHAHIEETIFYPALKQEAETREIIFEALDEHQEIKDLLQQLAGTPPQGNAFDNLCGDLKRAVEHHVKEEEGEMFPKAKDVLSPQQLDELGTRMEQEKQSQQTQKAASAR
jgi:iron-sulfur cluster repair protein YtfE (RIC family)